MQAVNEIVAPALVSEDLPAFDIVTDHNNLKKGAEK
jgi:hypothetical protein